MSVKLWLVVPAALVAVIVSGYTPFVLAAPVNVAVPLPLSTNVTPVGSVPALLSAAAGDPLVVTLKVPVLAAVNVAVAALVMVGAWRTTSEKFWVAVPAVLVALILTAYSWRSPWACPKAWRCRCRCRRT